MIQFEKYTLENGLKVVLHHDPHTPMVAVNILYNVGSKHEHPESTGFAHLFEHLMFGGTEAAPNFDEPIQDAGGENNAFTNGDFTNYYEVIPKDNLDTALWLEADRMKNLKLNQKRLDIQKKVVIEEFKETCLNIPYGDLWHELSDLIYAGSPYGWPTIGKDIKHIQHATLENVQEFYDRYYAPNNAVLVIAGGFNPDTIRDKIQYWFGGIKSSQLSAKDGTYEWFREDKTTEVVNQKTIPFNMFLLAFPMGPRDSQQYYQADMISDILANGRSSRLYQSLYKNSDGFTKIDAFISGSIEPGLLIIEGRVGDSLPIEDAIEKTKLELDKIKNGDVTQRELQKVKNKIVNGIEFGEVNLLNKAMSLAYFENLKTADMINSEVQKYQSIDLDDMNAAIRNLLDYDKMRVLTYRK